jgi:transcriptional regulator with XRE-family HTH domain
MADHGVTQAALSERSGVAAETVCRYLRGHRVPSLRNMVILDEALEELVDEKGAL